MTSWKLNRSISGCFSCQIGPHEASDNDMKENEFFDKRKRGFSMVSAAKTTQLSAVTTNMGLFPDLTNRLNQI